MPTAAQLAGVVRSTAGTPSTAQAADEKAPVMSWWKQMAVTTRAWTVEGRLGKGGGGGLGWCGGMAPSQWVGVQCKGSNFALTVGLRMTNAAAGILCPSYSRLHCKDASSVSVPVPVPPDGKLQGTNGPQHCDWLAHTTEASSTQL